MPLPRRVTRRRFLKLGLGAAGVVTVGPGMWLPVARAGPGEGEGRVVFRSGFEPGDADAQAPQHRIVEDVARSGKRSLVGEVARPNQACILKIPFESPPSHVLQVSFWVRSDLRSTAAAFVRVGDRRDRLGTLKRISSSKWVRGRFDYPVAAKTRGVVEIVAPSSYGAPAGRMWIDDVSLTLVPDACEWPAHVQDFPDVAADGSGALWMAVVERPVPRRLVRVYRVDADGPKAVCAIEPAGITGIGAPAVAGTGRGCVVAFPVERSDAWRIAYAFVGGSAGAADTVTPRVVECGGTSNTNPAVAAAGEDAWLLWETNEGGARGISACRIGERGHDRPVRLSSREANSYNPAVVALGGGGLFAAWDSLRDGGRGAGADIYGARCRGGAWEAERRITSDPRIERHPHLAARGGDVWMAWQAQSYKGNRINSVTEQRIAVARLDGNGLAAPKGLARHVLSRGDKLMRPRIGFDDSGRLWLTARRSLGMQAGWEPLAWCSGGAEWRGPVGLVRRSG
ncbi:MAG: twin-arginine translocation signal domain-containing protein, partial [Planctomycetota bacterium]